MVLAHDSQARREVLKSMIKAIFAHQVAAFFKWLGQNSINELIGRIQLWKCSLFYFSDRVANTTEGDDDDDDDVMENKYRTQTA